MFSSAGIFRTSSPGDTTSSDPERTALRRGEEPGYTEVLQQRTGCLNIRRLLSVKGNSISQVTAFRAFLCVGGCKSLGSLESSLSHASQPSWPSILCFHIPSCLGAHRREWLQPDGWCSSLPECPQGSRWRAGLPMTVTSLFSDMAGNAPLLNTIGFPFQLQLIA